MKLSIVTTLYNSSPYINEFYRRTTKVAHQLAGDDYEIIFVDDGSPDDSLSRAIDITKVDSKVLVVELSRNFGHHKAMMTALQHARGDFVYLLDSDLEEEPEWLELFMQQLHKFQVDVVYGFQENRRGGLFERLSGQWFYLFFLFFTGLALPANVVTARLMKRRYVNALLRHEERELFIAGVWCVTGFRQKGEIVIKHSTSETTYTLRRKLALLVNAVTSFSSLPLVAIFYIGISIFFCSSIYITYLVINWLFILKPLSGWTSVMASIWLVGGMIISFIGIVGIYLAKIYSEVKQRPYTIVREVYAKEVN